MHERTSTAGSQTETQYPCSWLWAEDGNTLDGTFVEFDEGMTRDFGARPIIVAVVAGEKRSLWLNETALRNRVADEVARRPSGDLDPGERLIVTRLGKKMSGNGREYVAFDVKFPDRPRRSAQDIFNVEPTASAATDNQTDAGDGIPF
jgi:hypothetical protein